MALRSGYKGIKRLMSGLKFLQPGVLSVDKDAFNIMMTETGTITFSEGLSSANVSYLVRTGNVVDLLTQVHGISDNTNDITVGVVPFLPKNSYAFVDVLSVSKPYARLGGGFIRPGTGVLVLAKNSNIPTNADVWVRATYICQTAPLSSNRTLALSPEDVPEEVIEEKPVTKKTTKKTTVKEGE